MAMSSNVSNAAREANMAHHWAAYYKPGPHHRGTIGASAVWLPFVLGKLLNKGPCMMDARVLVGQRTKNNR